MGSSGGGAGSNDRWWENPKLSPADLRQHSETWSLADDAAMATLLQGISQHLVSQTHEVEGALERALEETDRIVTTIANTNNAFHMLANTQFIENRTYQDDADIVREKKDLSEKPAVTEEDILARCRTAIADGLSLVAASYERHEIQDSDSDDDDSPGSPVPVYALIDPYENKPLPLIIGSEGFLSDDKVGLEISSSEENSRMTFSPEDTDTDGELEDETDRVTLQQKAIPASSSRAVDEDSDSDWSAEDDLLSDKSSTIVSKPRPLQLSSDEDDDMFGPSSRNSEKVGNIFSQKHNAGTTVPTTTTTHVNSRKTDLDSDSEEDEGLFGKQQKSSGLFDGFKQPSNSQGSTKNTEFLPQSAPAKSLGVENVRAMPGATPTTASGPVKSKKESNLFASDTDDEEDLFSSKPVSQGRTTNNLSHNQGDPPVSSSGGLFSSDDDSPLFSSLPTTQGPKNSKEDNEESPPQPKESTRKVPIGGVSIFGTAITSAIRRQQSSDGEPSDDELPNTNSIKDTHSPKSQPDVRVPQKPANVKMPVKGGLFDSDEDDNLFDTLVRKSVPVTRNDIENAHSSAVPSLSENKIKAEDEKSHIDKESISNLSGRDHIAKSSTGLFSDEEDNIFGSPITVEKKGVSIPGRELLPETSPKGMPEPTKVEGETEKASKPPPLFTPPDDQTPSLPVTISDHLKTNHHSLFGSPSDDDDDIFSSISKPVHKTSNASAFVTDPPPLPPQSSNSHTQSLSEGLPQLGAHGDANIDKAKVINCKENPNESISSNLFSSTSDEDIFSTITSHKSPAQTPAPQRSKEKTELSKPDKERELGTETDASVSHSEMGASEGISCSPGDNVFTSVSQPLSNEPKQDEIVEKSDGASERLPISFPQKDVNLGSTSSKDENLFSSMDDLFGVSTRLDKPCDSTKKVEDTHGLWNPNIQKVEAINSSIVSRDTDMTAPSGLHEDNSSLPPSPSSSEDKPSSVDTRESRRGAAKPPVGGVALFGGKELAAQINKRKTLLETTQEKEQKIENKITDGLREPVSESEDHSKSVIFDESDDDIFGNITKNSKEVTSSSLYRQSPPLLPEEAEEHSSKKQESERVPIPKSDPMNVDAEPKKFHGDSDQQKPSPDRSQVESKEEIVSKAIQPKKKPPIGGVSMFGSGGMGGSELFAKVQQRKSMLAPDSDSSEEDTPHEPTGTTKPITPSEEKGTAFFKPVVSVSPVSPISPVFAPDIQKSKPGGEETSVSFDDPATHTNILQSVNKTRARGSIKRRPPSRAHRKGGSGEDKSDLNDTQVSSTTEAPPPSTMASSPEHISIKAADVNKAEFVEPSERLRHPSADKGQKNKSKDVEENEVESSKDMQTVTSMEGSNHTEDTVEAIRVSHEKNKEVAPMDNMLNASKSDSRIAKTSSKQGNSLFGGSDSDEDLFGEVKQKQMVSSGATSILKKAGKNSRSDSLFEDDDDASIFSLKSQTKKATAGESKNVPVTKPKGNLKQSSEPFEDPLLGSLTK